MIPRLWCFAHHGRRDPTEVKRLQALYDLGNGALYAKHGFKDWRLLLRILRDIRRGLWEFFGGPLADEEFGISHRDNLRGNLKGAMRFWFGAGNQGEIDLLHPWLRWRDRGQRNPISKVRSKNTVMDTRNTAFPLHCDENPIVQAAVRSPNKQVVVYYNGTFIYSRNGAHARMTSLLQYLVKAGYSITLFSFRNHPTEPWTIAAEAAFKAAFPTVQLVLDTRTATLRCLTYIKNALTSFFPAESAPYYRLALPRSEPEL